MHLLVAGLLQAAASTPEPWNGPSIVPNLICDLFRTAKLSSAYWHCSTSLRVAALLFMLQLITSAAWMEFNDRWICGISTCLIIAHLEALSERRSWWDLNSAFGVHGATVNKSQDANVEDWTRNDFHLVSLHC
jgi:hypothetical protein